MPRNPILTALMVLLLFSCTCYAQIEEQAMLEQARQHFLTGRYYFATSWLGRILRDYPATHHRKEVLLLLAKAHALSGRDEKATQYLHGLLKEFPEVFATLDPELSKLANSAKITPPDPLAKPAAPAPPAGDQANVPTPAEPPARPPIPAPQPAKPVQQLAAPAPPPQSPVQPPPPVKPPTPGNPPLPPPAAEDGAVFYTLSAGETLSQRKVEALMKKLKGTGFQPVVDVDTRNSEVFRLLSECYGDRKSAEKRRTEISRNSQGIFVIRNEDSFCVVAGSLMSESAAMQEQKRLAGKGLRVKVVKFRVPLTFLRISIGRFADPREADQAAHLLAARGIGVTVVKAVD